MGRTENKLKQNKMYKMKRVKEYILP